MFLHFLPLLSSISHSSYFLPLKYSSYRHLSTQKREITRGAFISFSLKFLYFCNLTKVLKLRFPQFCLLKMWKTFCRKKQKNRVKFSFCGKTPRVFHKQTLSATAFAVDKWKFYFSVFWPKKWIKPQMPIVFAFFTSFEQYKPFFVLFTT